MEKKITHYDAVDGLRTFSCLGIILMHIQANTEYFLKGSFFFDKFIPSLTFLVYLFLMISGFGMSAGYLDKFKSNNINIELFYKKRYMKIVPFLGVLLLIALVVEHDISTIYEISVEILLLHGLLPNNAVSVIGVCWTLGVIFLFYLLFPAFSILMNKKIVWLSLAISIWIIFVCEEYFFSSFFVTESFTPRHNFLYCLPMFISGGIIYLYRDEIKRKCELNKNLIILICFFITIIWYLIPRTNAVVFYISNIILFGLWLAYAVGTNSKFLASKPMRYLSKISMEMYLAQMVIFRIVEKLNLLYIFGNSGILGWISLFIAFILVIIGLIIFIYCYKIIIKKIEGEYRDKNVKI